MQPVEYRSINQGVLANENKNKNIDLLNEVLGDVELTPSEEKSLTWLCGWHSSTVRNVISAFMKAKGNL